METRWISLAWTARPERFRVGCLTPPVMAGLEEWSSSAGARAREGAYEGGTEFGLRLAAISLFTFLSAPEPCMALYLVTGGAAVFGQRVSRK